MRQRRRARARRDTLNVQPRSPFYSGRGLGAREQLAPSVLKRIAAVVGPGGTKGLEREQGVNQGEGRKDSRRAQPESAGCSACQAQGWAGDDVARALPTLQSLPSAGCHPTHG